MIWIFTLLALFLIWNLIPHLIVWSLPVDSTHKLNASKCWLKVAVIHFIQYPVGFLAPFIVPIALLFTKHEDAHLPALFRWWDNDVSINGDRAEDWALDFKGNAYYAKAPPRSFWARYVWLGLRNRASWLGEHLGYKYKEGEYDAIFTYGNPHTSRTWPDGEGWMLKTTGSVYQLMVVKHITSKLCIRTHWGYKLFDRDRAPIVAIAFSVLSWRVEQ